VGGWLRYASGNIGYVPPVCALVVLPVSSVGGGAVATLVTPVRDSVAFKSLAPVDEAFADTVDGPEVLASVDELGCSIALSALLPFAASSVVAVLATVLAG